MPTLLPATAHVEVFDDLTSQLEVSSTVYKVRKPPYEPGSLSVWRNGLLQDKAFATELDPVAGLFELAEALKLYPAGDFSLHVSYCTEQPVFVDPEAPVHISQIKPGDVVRVAMKAGRHLEPRLVPKDKQFRLEPGRAPSGRSARVKAFSRTVFLGFVTQNDFLTGKLYLQVEDRGRRQHLAATVPYSDILIIQKHITPGKQKNVGDVTIGGGPRALRRPGIAAKGVNDSPGFLNLVKVYF